nr:helix-turn-helix domain-containing protein [Evansella caseinilytica]
MNHKSERHSIPVISAATMQTIGFSVLPLIPERIEEVPSSYDLHRHDCFELFWIKEGRGEVQIDFQSYSFSPNTLCLISPGQVHGLIDFEASEAFSGWLLIFSKELFAEQFLEWAEWAQTSLLDFMEENPFRSIAGDQATVFNMLFHLLEREQETGRKDQLVAVSNYIRVLLVEMGRIHNAWQQRHREKAGYRLTKQYVAAVESHYRTVHSVAEYAAMLHVTPNHLNESIKKTLGKSAGGVLRDRHILEAKRLLRYSSAQVAEIASYLGFHDASYFGRFFKKNTGLTPTAFRRGCVKSQND